MSVQVLEGVQVGSTEPPRRVRVREIRYRQLCATIWRWDTCEPPAFSVTLGRQIVVSKPENLGDHDGFEFADLINLIAVLHDVYTFIEDLQAGVAKVRVE
jgi:hypothetical protein